MRWEDWKEKIEGPVPEFGFGHVKFDTLLNTLYVHCFSESEG